MIGKTNAHVRGTHYTVGPVEISADNCTYWPTDYSLDYFDRVVVPRNPNNFLVKLTTRTLVRFSEEEAGTPTSIPERICYRQPMLGSIDLPSSVTKVEQYAFSQCTNLRTVRIVCPSLTTIDTYGFADTGMTHLYLDAPRLNSLRYGFYNNKSLTDLTLVSVRALDTYSFYECDHLSNVTLPAMCESVGQQCFSVYSQSTDYSDLYLTFTRQAVYTDGTLTQDVTTVHNNLFYGRADGRYWMFVPLQSLYAYRYRFAASNARYITYSAAYVDCDAGQTLPTTVTQSYRGNTQTLSLVWYSDKTLSTPVTTTPTAGRYYGVATDVQ